MKRIEKNGQIYNVTEVLCKKGFKELGWFPIEKAPTPEIKAVKFDNGQTTSDPYIIRKAYIYIKNDPEAFMLGELKGLKDIKPRSLREYLESWDKEYLNEGIGDKIKKFSIGAIIAAILAGSLINPSKASALDLEYNSRSTYTDSRQNKDFKQRWYESITKHPLIVGIEDPTKKEYWEIKDYIDRTHKELDKINWELERKYGEEIKEKEHSILTNICKVDYKDWKEAPDRKREMEEEFKEKCMKIRKKYQEKLLKHLTEGFSITYFAERPDWERELDQHKEFEERFASRYKKISEEFFKEYMSFLEQEGKKYETLRKQEAPTLLDKAEKAGKKIKSEVKTVGKEVKKDYSRLKNKIESLL